MKYLIGCDVGTSGTKTVLFDESGKIISSAYRSYPLYQPETGWAEQDPDGWADAAFATIAEAVAESGVDPSDVAGIGLSGQMHGLVMLDEKGKVLRKSIIWCDQRTQEECVLLTSLIGGDRLKRITGNPAITGFTAPKILWVQRHEPETWRKCAHILLPKDYVRFRLTGQLITDMADGSGMQLADIGERRYSKEMLGALSIDENMVPVLKESASEGGRLTAEAAKKCGLRQGLPVAASAGDQAAAAIGNGVVREGLFSCNVGTSGVVFAHTDTPLCDPSGRVQTFCHAVPGKWHVMGVTQGAGLSMKWFKDNFYAEEAARNPKVYKVIDDGAATISAGTSSKTGTMTAASAFLDVPARNSIPIMRAPTHIVTDILGSSMMSTHTESPAPSTGRHPFRLCMRAGSRAKYPAEKSTKPSFASSEGWIVREPIPIQRVAP